MQPRSTAFLAANSTAPNNIYFGFWAEDQNMMNGSVHRVGAQLGVARISSECIAKYTHWWKSEGDIEQKKTGEKQQLSGN